MKIISIEGLDKAGKYTQAEMLKDYLEKKGKNVVKSEFHRYDTPTGELIMKWLTNKWDVDQYTIELIMTADKQAQQRWFTQLEKEGVDFLILDRYTGSQLAYSSANKMDSSWIRALQVNIREPDIEIFIDIPAEESMKRKGKHNNGENDRYESDLKMLKNVREIYDLYISNKVDGMKNPSEVHKDIVSIINDLSLI